MHLALLFSPHRTTSFRSCFSFSRAEEHFEIVRKAVLWQWAVGIVTCWFLLQRCYSSLKPWENSQSLICVQLYLVVQFHCLKSLTPCSSSKSPFEGNIHCYSFPSPTLSCWVPFLYLQPVRVMLQARALCLGASQQSDLQLKATAPAAQGYHAAQSLHCTWSHSFF